MTDQETEVFEYGLTLLCIKMNVKFPCKMKLEYNGNGLTSEAPVSDAQKFVFNQEVTLKE